jgi:hypothetical protein
MKTRAINIVEGFKFIPGSFYTENLDRSSYDAFKEFYARQVMQDPYSPVRDRAMIKLIYNRSTSELSVNPIQSYFQSYGANDTDGGRTRIFPLIKDEILSNDIFKNIFLKDSVYINTYCDKVGANTVNLSIHFIRYKAERGGASYSSPVWLHLDDEPLVFIHLIELTTNAIGADSVISEMDSKPTHVLRLTSILDTLIVDRMKKHAVTPLGSTQGTAYRDVMLVNLEAEVQQK